MAESRKPAFHWSAINKRWEIYVGEKSGPIVHIDGNGLSVNKGSLSYSSVTVGTLTSTRTLNVNTTGSVQNLSVGTLATIQAINVGATGTIRDLNVPTLATLRAINTAGVGTIADARITRLILGAGGTVSLIQKFTGTIALAAIGTNTMAVATVTGQGSAGIAVGDLISVVPKAALSGVALGGAYIPTTNVVNVYVVNPNSQGGGSLPAVGVDMLVVRST